MVSSFVSPYISFTPPISCKNSNICNIEIQFARHPVFKIFCAIVNDVNFWAEILKALVFERIDYHFIYYIDSYSIEENRQAERELNSLNWDCVDD